MHLFACLMTVAELIAALSAHDPALPVVIDGYEGGALDVHTVTGVNIRRDVNDPEDFLGPHEIVRPWAVSKFGDTLDGAVSAVYLPRHDVSSDAAR